MNSRRPPYGSWKQDAGGYVRFERESEAGGDGQLGGSGFLFIGCIGFSVVVWALAVYGFVKLIGF